MYVVHKMIIKHFYQFSLEEICRVVAVESDEGAVWLPRHEAKS